MLENIDNHLYFNPSTNVIMQKPIVFDMKDYALEHYLMLLHVCKVYIIKINLCLHQMIKMFIDNPLLEFSPYKSLEIFYHLSLNF